MTPLDKMRDALNACRIRRWERTTDYGKIEIRIGWPFGSVVGHIDTNADAEGFSEVPAVSGWVEHTGYLMWAGFTFDASGNCVTFEVLE